MYDRKPNCSYNCLIGMALKSSESGRLPVGEIYRFFEREFPYFLSAPEPWKNSLRHSLSLGHYFRKYNSEKLVTKKGHLWEVNPQRAAELDKEMYMFLARGLPDNVPSSPQLSKLRLQMTQLLLDSIKNTRTPPPSSSHQNHRHHSSMYAIGPPPPPVQPMLSSSFDYAQQTMQGVPQTFKRPGTDIVMLAPPALFRGEAQTTMVYSTGPTTVLSPGDVPNCNGMGRLFTSTPTRQHSMSSQLPLTTPRPSPRPVYNLTPEAQAPARLGGFHHHQGLERAGTGSQKEGEMCEEAYQLVQFCNHCSVGGLEGGNQPEPSSPAIVYPSRQNDVSTAQNQVAVPPRKTVAPQLSHFGETLLTTETAIMMEMGQDVYYPFINPPTKESDIALAKLNGFHSYCLNPSPPSELTITKCKPKPKNMSRECMEFDKAVRPFMHDWNAIWVAERILHLMNDECFMNFIEHRTGEDIKNFLARRTKIRKSLKIVTTPKEAAGDASSVTPTQLGSTRSATGKPTCDTPKRPKRNYSSVRKLELKETSSTPTVNKFKKFKNASGKTVEQPSAEGNEILSLIVSIPFRKLITERQMKKYCSPHGGRSCGAKTRTGGKQRVSTK